MADQTFGIIVEVDPKRAIPTIDQVEGKLASAERTGKRAARTISEEFERSAQTALRAVEKSTRAQEAANKRAGREAAAAAKQAGREQEEHARHVTMTVERQARERAAAERAAYRETVAAAKAAAREQVAAARAAAQQQRAAARQAQVEVRANAGSGNLGAIASGAGIPLGAAAGAAVAVGLAKGALDLSDSYANLTSRLITLTGEESKAIPLREKLLKIAAETKSANTAIVELYARTAGSAKELGISEGRLLDFTERLTKSFKTSGASAVAQQQAMIQLAQGMGAGALRGEEFNSVMEAAPNIIDVIGQHLNKTRGQMRAMAEEGQLTTAVIIEAFEKAGPSIDEKFGKRIVTTADHVQGLKNKLEVTIGTLGQQINISGLAGQAIGELGKSLEVLSDIVSAQVGFWKAADDALGGYLGAAAKAPGLLGGISNVVGALAGDGGLMRLMTEDTIADTKAQEANAEAIRKRTYALYDNAKAMADAAVARTGGGTGLSPEDEQALRNRELTLEQNMRNRGGLSQSEFDQQRLAKAQEARRAAKAQAGDDAETLGVAFADVSGAAGRMFDSIRDGVAAAKDSTVGLATQAQKTADEMEERRSKFAAGLRDFAEGVEKFQRAAEEAQEKSVSVGKVLGGAFSGIAIDGVDRLVDSLNGASVSVGDFARAALGDLEKLLIRLLAFQAIKATLGVDGGLGGMLAKGLGFAAGGSFTVPNGGSGGTDSVPVFFRATPGERVSVQTPGQQSAGGGGGNVTVPVKVVAVDDRDAAAREMLSSAEGERAVLAIIAKNRGKLRSMIAG